MARSRTIIVSIFLSIGLVFAMAQTWASSTLIGSTIMEIGPDGRQVTIKTTKGESFSLDVANPDALKGVSKGDQVSIELDSQDRVHKIVKFGDEAERPKPRVSGDSEY